MPHDLLAPVCIIGAVVLIWLLSRRTGGASSASAVQPPTDSHFRLAQLEAKVNFLMKTLGVTDDMPVDDEVQGFLARGMKIEAIKAYRTQNPGAGLKDAKDAVDALEAQSKARQR